MSRSPRTARWSRLFSLLVLGGALGASRIASADPPSTPHTEAAERFDRGIRLVDEGDLSGGLAEFQRAYALAPLPLVLYNVGLVYAELGRPVESAHALQEVLAKPQGVSAEHLTRAMQVLAKQVDRIGQVSISANVPEGDVELDGVQVAKWPLAGPLTVASGPHVVGVVARGYAPTRQEVRVAAHQHEDVALVLVAVEGVLAHVAVHTHVPNADVLIDGKLAGKTPLDATLTVLPGKHRIEVRRAGYTAASKDLDLQDGATGEVTLEPAVDTASLAREGGWLSMDASETQAVVRMDGQDLGVVGEAMRVPAGSHRLHFERAGFLEADRDVEVPLGGTLRVRVVFEPTPETRVRFVSGATARRTWSIVTMVLGAAIAGAGAALAVVEDGQLPAQRSDLATAEAAFGPGQPCDTRGAQYAYMMAACNAAVNDASSKINSSESLRTAGWIAAGAGGAVLVAGAVLLFTGDDPHRYDQRPVQPLLEGWSIVPAVGKGTVGVSVGARF